MKAYKTPDYRMSDHPVIEYLKMLEEEAEDEQEEEPGFILTFGQQLRDINALKQ